MNDLHSGAQSILQVSKQHVKHIHTLAAHWNSFTMVRHPFERLVSFYQDMMAEKNEPSKLVIGQTIMKMFDDISFDSFVKYILAAARANCKSYSSCRLDWNWLPYVARCSHCQIPYKYILKFETFDEDRYMLGNVTQIPFQGLKIDSSSSESTRELTKQYFSALPSDLFDKVLELYWADFEMFEYDPYEYRKTE